VAERKGAGEAGRLPEHSACSDGLLNLSSDMGRHVSGADGRAMWM
jgi:hypothetical protein